MSRPNFNIVEDNTAPDYVITCTRDGTAIDLSNATSVSLKIQRTSDKVITQASKAAVITTPSSGVITYSADITDFPSKGTYVADLIVLYNTGNTEILYNQAKWKVRSKLV